MMQDRYEQFMHIIHQWQHLKMLERMGRGHDSAGVDNTKEGTCAILCPACPQPGKNLPDDWDKAPKSKEYVFFSSFYQHVLILFQVALCSFRRHQC